MKKSFLISALAICALMITSCKVNKQVAYLQNVDKTEVNDSIIYDAHIMPKNLLSITVSSSDPEAAIPFNLVVPSQGAMKGSLISQPVLQNYLVDNSGNINFPILGKLKVGGLTTTEAADMICEKVKQYVKQDPVVTVRIMNYKISVLGEVEKPGVFDIPNEKVTIFEALAMAGDMTIHGRRDTVKIIREDVNFHKHIIPVDLNNAQIVHSPYYYLQQNDQVYVEPNKTRKTDANISTSTTLILSATSILISIASLIVNILR